jgi:hypothetical protein
VQVTNAESTILSLACKAPRITDKANPLYELEEPNTSVVLPAGKSTVIMNLPENWHVYSSGTCSFECTSRYQELTATIGNESGKGYFVSLDIPVSSTINGYALDVELSTEAECKAAW